MKFLIPEQETEGNNLQGQKEQKIEISSDEKKDISHLQIKFKIPLQ